MAMELTRHHKAERTIIQTQQRGEIITIRLLLAETTPIHHP